MARCVAASRVRYHFASRATPLKRGSVGRTGKSVIAFQISINGEHVCTAGVGDLGVLSAILTWVRRSPEKSRNGKSFEEELTIEVGGLSEGVSSRWLSRTLSVGDVIGVKVVSVRAVDNPASIQREDPRLVEKSERRYLESLKQKYGRKKRSPRTESKPKPNSRR